MNHWLGLEFETAMFHISNTVMLIGGIRQKAIGCICLPLAMLLAFHVFSVMQLHRLKFVGIYLSVPLPKCHTRFLFDNNYSFWGFSLLFDSLFKFKYQCTYWEPIFGI